MQFGYHRSYAANERVDRSKSRGVCYQKVAGAPPSVDIEGLLSLRPLVRRKKREHPIDDSDEPPRRRPALGLPLLLNHRLPMGQTPIAPMPPLPLNQSLQSLDSMDSMDEDMSLDDADAARSLLSLNQQAA